MPNADMIRLLDEWIQQNPCPASRSVQNLWLQGAAQERLAMVAVIELQARDGDDTAPEDHQSSRYGDIQLTAQLRRFPRPGLELAFIADLQIAPAPDVLIVASAPDEPELAMIPATGQRVRPRNIESVHRTHTAG
jgi:hypothetical protein